MLSSQHDTTNDCVGFVIAHKKPSPVSNLTTTDQVDTDSNNDDTTQYLVIPIRQNNSTTEIPETTTTTTPVQPNVYYHLCKISSSTSTTSLKLYPYEKIVY